MGLTPIEFLAQMINEKKSKEEGYSMPTRWLTLREDLKQEYKVEAWRIFEEWKDDEIRAEKSRNDSMKDVTIKYYKD